MRRASKSPNAHGATVDRATMTAKAAKVGLGLASTPPNEITEQVANQRISMRDVADFKRCRTVFGSLGVDPPILPCLA